jgi:hypothetical protein
LVHNDFQHGAVLAWGRDPQALQLQEISIWITELYGLPGDRYLVDINIDDMTFWFRDQQDRMIFVLRNGSARCTQLDQTTLTS